MKERKICMTRAFTEILILVLNIASADTLALIAGPIQKVMNKMDEAAFQNFAEVAVSAYNFNTPNYRVYSLFHHLRFLQLVVHSGRYRLCRGLDVCQQAPHLTNLQKDL